MVGRLHQEAVLHRHAQYPQPVLLSWPWQELPDELKEIELRPKLEKRGSARPFKVVATHPPVPVLLPP